MDPLTECLEMLRAELGDEDFALLEQYVEAGVQAMIATDQAQARAVDLERVRQIVKKS